MPPFIALRSQTYTRDMPAAFHTLVTLNNRSEYRTNARTDYAGASIPGAGGPAP